MQLTDLEPQWLQWISDSRHKRIPDMTAADGLLFLCPVCYQTNNGPIGTHAIICWQPHITVTIPGDGRWRFVGTSYADLSLVNGSSSIRLTNGCNAHFFIRNGNIEFC